MFSGTPEPLHYFSQTVVGQVQGDAEEKTFPSRFTEIGTEITSKCDLSVKIPVTD